MLTRIDLLRHGLAAPDSDGGDAMRPLTAAGAARIEALGAELGRRGWRPERAFTSPLKRARDTAALVLAAAGAPLTAEILEELGPERDPAHVAALLAEQYSSARHVLLVAHQPLLGRLAEHWTGAMVPVAPGDLLAIRFEPASAPRAGRLVERLTSA